MKKYNNLSLGELRKGHRYDFVMPVIVNGDEVMKEHHGYRFDHITATEVMFAEPEDEDGVTWEFPIPIDIAQTLRFNVSSEGDTDAESQSQNGGRRKNRKTKTVKKNRKNKKTKAKTKRRRNCKTKNKRQ